MPVVGMRRTTRVFGVVKSGADGARILRSGKKLWPSDLDDGKLKKTQNSGRDEWLKLIGETGVAPVRKEATAGRARILRSGKKLWPSDKDDGKLKKTQNSGRDEWLKLIGETGVAPVRKAATAAGWCRRVSPRRAEARSVVKNGDCNVVCAVERVSGRKIERFYERKRKRYDWNEKLGCSIVKRFGNHFVRRQKKRKAAYQWDKDLVLEPFVHAHAVVVQFNGNNDVDWFVRFLNSVLGYLIKAKVKLSQLHGFLSSNPIVSVFSSHGIDFLQDRNGSYSPGVCKIFRATKFAPSFSVTFSAIPSCFMHMHSDMLLRSEQLVFQYLVNGGSNFDDEDLDDSDEILSSILSTDHIATVEVAPPVGSTSRKRKVSHQTAEVLQVSRHHMRLRNSLNEHSIRGKRSPRSRRGRSNPFGHSVSDSLKIKSSLKSLPSPLFTTSSRKKVNPSNLTGLLENSVAPLLERNGSVSLPLSDSAEALGLVEPERAKNIEELKSTSIVPKEVAYSTSCTANILLIGTDRCYRQEGASVMLELSASNRWLIVVTNNGLTKYSHMAEHVMKPCGSNRITRAIIWTIEENVKLEFTSRDEWAVYKELYKECYRRNLQLPSDKSIPVPGVRLVSSYEDATAHPYTRPEAYIRFVGDEASRALSRRTAIYDLDSEDEEWLTKYNEEMSLNGFRLTISPDIFELMIDAIEKALYFNPGDYLDTRALTKLCPDFGHDDGIELVYKYWVKKRKLKSPALVRVMQAHKPRRDLHIRDPVLRKKRSFKRQAIHNGRGKQRFLRKVLGVGKNDVGEQLATIELEEANASLKKFSDEAIRKRHIAQSLMEKADLATYKAVMALKIAEAAKDAGSFDSVISTILM